MVARNEAAHRGDRAEIVRRVDVLAIDDLAPVVHEITAVSRH
jgi:hypothetical protein